MNAKPTIRIQPARAGPGPLEVALSYQNGETYLSANTNIASFITPEDEESIRWYLEEYRQFPFEPAITIARNTSAQLRQFGEELFDQVFNTTAESRDLWSRAEEQLGSLRVEIAGDNSGLAAPWESLWNPLDAVPVACRAASFVRCGRFTDASPAPNAGSAIRILLVISRPAGILDAPFRSVAARLLDRVGDDRRFLFDILRPPTFEALQSTLRAAADQGRPYTVVHFDGHGVHEDLNAKLQNRRASRRQGYLLFEAPFDPGQPDFINASMFGEALAAGRTPILILNACRSARTDLWTEQMGSRRPLGSFADQLMAAGQPAVLAMQYNIQVETASRFIADLYECLARGSLAEAVQVGRRNLFAERKGMASDQRVELHDWLVPVLFERSPQGPLHRDAEPVGASRDPGSNANIAFGADDTLIAIERAFQTASSVLLRGPIGSGKTRIADEFAAWDTRTRRHEDVARSPLRLVRTIENATAEVFAGGSRVLIETRDENLSPTADQAIVCIAPLDLPDRIALIRQRLPEGTTFDAELWQPVLVFSQGNPGALLNIAALIAKVGTDDPDPVLEIARSQPVGLDPEASADVLAGLSPADMSCLAPAAIFEGPVSSRLLATLASLGSGAIGYDDADTALSRLAELGLTTPLGSGYYQLHPGVPALLRPAFESRYPGAQEETIHRAMLTLITALCAVLYKHADSRKRDAHEQQMRTLNLIEPTIQRVLDLAISSGDWHESSTLAAALRRVRIHEGRRPEWQKLAARLHSLVPEDANGTPPPGRESLWQLLQQDRVESLLNVHSLEEAAWLQERLLQHVRNEYALGEGSDASEYFTEVLIPQLRRMGDVRKKQCQPDAVSYYLEALESAQRLSAVSHEQRIAADIAALHFEHDPIDWSEVSYWHTYAMDICPSHDRIGRAQLKILDGKIALARSQPGEAIEHLNDALTGLLPAYPSTERAECEAALAQALFEHQGSLPEAMRHMQSAIAWYEKDQNIFWVSCARLTASRILSKSGEQMRATYYAEAAARGFASLAPHAERQAVEASRLAAACREVSGDGA